MSAIYQDGKWYVSTGLEVHSGFTPIGTIISVMGTTAPMNYLVCNGQVVNISDYPELALYFETQFGSKNKFGGDGTTTFAVPDLRGEFLRGTGKRATSPYSNGGADVGTHQEPTLHKWIDSDANAIGGTQTGGLGHQDWDSGNTGGPWNYARSGVVSGNSWKNHYTSRPTNTAVLYCIATKNIFMDAGQNYSTEEQIVGTWIDGKPIYQKVLVFPKSSFSGYTSNINHNIQNIDSIIKFEVTMDWNTDNRLSQLPFTYCEGTTTGTTWYGGVSVTKSVVTYQLGSNIYNSLVKSTCIIRYTKTTD